MTPQDITRIMLDLFGGAVQSSEPQSWTVEQGNLRLLLLVSDDQTWLRALASIATVSDAQPYLAQLLEANFDATQETRYALYEGVLWGVFQHSLASLTEADLRTAIARLVALQEQGLRPSFEQLAETQIRQIIRAAKANGQSLEATLQTLARFYQEGIMGDLGQTAAARDQVMNAWRYQLQRLWDQDSPL
jgi:triphosphoribosyl-dephospho-CoA synthetase